MKSNDPYITAEKRNCSTRPFGELELGVTKEHPFFVYDKGWVAAGELELGDVCRSAADTEIVLTSKEFDANPVPVYNFEVEEGHTYFVGEMKEVSVLVHNTCPNCGGDGKYIGTRNNNILDRSFYFITTGGRSLSKQEPIWKKCPCILPDNSPSGTASPRDVFRNLPREAGKQIFDENSFMSIALKEHPVIKNKAAELTKQLSENYQDGPNFGSDPAVTGGNTGEADWSLYSVHSGKFAHGDQWGFIRLAEDLTGYGMITYLNADKYGVLIPGTPYGGTALPPIDDSEVARTMLGSFRYTWRVVDLTDESATIVFRVYNLVSRESGTGGILYNTEKGFWADQHQYLTIKIKTSLK